MSLSVPRICGTRAWKREHPAAAPAAAGLLRGAVHLADLEFTGPGGPWSVPPGDLATVARYLALAVGPIAAYAGQYGPTTLAVGRRLPRRSVPVANGTYIDRDLQGWVDAMASDAGLPAGDAVLVLNPPGVVNRDARERGGVGVLGYHGLAAHPYAFVNLLGGSLTVDDGADRYAEAVSHEVAEMTVDPRADGANPEVCDGCGTNCRGTGAFRAYFDAAGGYLGSAAAFPPNFAYGFFVSAVAQPSVAGECPAPAVGCAYPPPGAARR